MRTRQADCQHEQTIGWGKDRYGNARRKCKACGATRGIIPARPLGAMRLSMDKAVVCLSMLTEGSSIRSTERVTGVHRDTICRLLRVAGAKCEALLSRVVQDVEVKDVQADEIWCYIGMKQKTKERKGKADPELGDAYTFIAVERHHKLALAWHLGKRDYESTSEFVGKLKTAARGKLRPDGSEEKWQLSTDGWGSYPNAIDWHLGGRCDYAQLIKQYGKDTTDGEQRYSPPRIIGTERIAVSGEPVESRVCTSHVERHNLHVRMQLRRFTRLTNAFSRRKENLRAALAVHFAAYNFTWMHSAIRCTPAMAAGIARKPWSMRDLLAAA